MIYGNAEFLDMPWETIIKIYRDRLGSTSFPTLEEYGRDLMQFMGNGKLFTETKQVDEAIGSIFAYFKHMDHEISETVKVVIEKRGKLTSRQARRIISSVIERHSRTWDKAVPTDGTHPELESAIRSKYTPRINKVIGQVFAGLPIGERALLRNIAVQLTTKRLPETISHESISGVVVAGFGEAEVFPSLLCFDIDGMVENKIRHWEHHHTKIGNELKDTSATIVPFAQSDAVETFMEGIDPGYARTQSVFLATAMRYLVDEAVALARSCGCSQTSQVKALRTGLTRLRHKMRERYGSIMDEYSQSQFVDPVVNVVAMLPKNELASIAETLVSLTLFKRRVSPETETVAGAIDVAVVSKGDGFVWVKRKLYFDAQLNPRFMANIYRNAYDETEKCEA